MDPLRSDVDVYWSGSRSDTLVETLSAATLTRDLQRSDDDGN